MRYVNLQLTVTLTPVGSISSTHTVVLKRTVFRFEPGVTDGEIAAIL